jgi:hypothetical protein
LLPLPVSRDDPWSCRYFPPCFMFSKCLQKVDENEKVIYSSFAKPLHKNGLTFRETEDEYELLLLASWPLFPLSVQKRKFFIMTPLNWKSFLFDIEKFELPYLTLKCSLFLISYYRPVRQLTQVNSKPWIHSPSFLNQHDIQITLKNYENFCSDKIDGDEIISHKDKYM